MPSDTPGYRATRIRRAKARPPREAVAEVGRPDEVEIAGDEVNRLALYELKDVRIASGMAHSIADVSSWGEEPPLDTEHQSRLADIIGRGDAGRWRNLARPHPDSIETIEKLVARAPHLKELSRLATMHLRAAATIGLPIQLPPVLLVGPPGVGKSWYLSKFSAALGLPFRRHSMSSSTLAEGFQGAHPSWRNAQPGLVAKTLLSEAVANPIVFVDEFDKVAAHSFNADPFRAFYALLDPSDAAAFTDEYLGFPMDASRVIWVMAANDADCLPAPIADRLKILHVPEPDAVQRGLVARSIYADANGTRRSFFEKEMSPLVVERLADMTPRTMRRRLDDAMACAASDGRRHLVVDDLVDTASTRSRKRFGFCG